MQVAQATIDTVVKKEEEQLRIPLYTQPSVDVNNIDWCEWKIAVKDTLQYIRERASQIREPREITVKKLDAVRGHDPRNGNITVCNLGTDDHPILKGIPIRKKLTSN